MKIILFFKNNLSIYVVVLYIIMSSTCMQLVCMLMTFKMICMLKTNNDTILFE